MCTCYCYFLQSTCTDCWVVEGEDFGEGDTIWGCVDLVYVNMMGLYFWVFFRFFWGVILVYYSVYLNIKNNANPRHPKTKTNPPINPPQPQILILIRPTPSLHPIIIPNSNPPPILPNKIPILNLTKIIPPYQSFILEYELTDSEYDFRYWKLERGIGRGFK